MYIILLSANIYISVLLQNNNTTDINKWDMDILIPSPLLKNLTKPLKM